MSKCNFDAYEGQEKYIFISYAHKDSELVYPIIENINASGYRVWYDDGISPGSEWPEYIAKHLDACDTVIFFISPNSIASENCRREVTFSMTRNKKFLGIELVPTEYSLGMELQLSSQQCIFKHEYSDESQFYTKLYSTPFIQGCRFTDGERFGDASFRDDAYGETADAVTNTNSDRVPGLVYEEKPTRQAKDTSNSKKKLTYALLATGGVLAFVILVILVLWLVLFSSNIKLTDNTTASTKDTFLTIYGAEITPSTIKKLSKMKKLDSLTISDSSFTGGADLGGFSRLDGLDSLVIENCTGIGDFSFLSEMTELRELSITNCPQLTSIDNIHPEKLEMLNISNTGVTGIDAVLSAPNLYDLQCENCSITSINGVLASTEFGIVNFNGCSLSDLAFLDNAESINVLKLAGNPIKDVSFLHYRCSDINELDLSNTDITPEMFDVISGCLDVNILRLNGIPMNDLSVTSRMSELTELSCSNCGLTSTNGLNPVAARNLESLDLSNNNLTELPEIGSKDAIYPEINLSSNKITSLAPLKYEDYSALVISFNPIDYSDPGTTDVIDQNIRYFCADYDEALIAHNDGQWDLICITECPDDKRSEVKEVFGYNFSEFLVKAQIDEKNAEFGTDFYRW